MDLQETNLHNLAVRRVKARSTVSDRDHIAPSAVSASDEARERPAVAHPAALPKPVLTSDARCSVQKPKAPAGLLARLRRSRTSAPVVDDAGLVAVPWFAHAVAVPLLPGQNPSVGYTLVTSGLPMPSGGGGYVLEHPAGATLGRLGPRRSQPTQATIVAYVDGYGRGFSAGSLQQMPPARTPDVQFKRYADAAAHSGCVEVATGPNTAARLAEYDETRQGAIELVGSRVELGDAAKTAGLAQAVAVAFLALWLFPRREGVSLTSVSVRDTFEHLRSSDLFEVLRNVLADARVGEDHPLLAPPSVLSYLAYNLRAAGLEGLEAIDLAPTDPWTATPRGVGVPFIDSLPGIHQAPTGSLMAAMRAAFEASGIPGLAVLGAPSGVREPRVRLVRTSAYANAFYVGFDRRQVSADGARKLLEAESLLNRFVLMVGELDREGVAQTASLAQVSQLDAWIVDDLMALARPYITGDERDGLRADTGSSELDVRLSFARGCESLRVPFRLEYGFRYDSEAQTLVVDVECPSAALMSRAEWDSAASAWCPRTYAQKEALASRYALHLMVVVAAVGFWSGVAVQQVAVNCWHGFGSSAGVDELVVTPDGTPRGLAMNEPACVATAVFERERFAKMLATPQDLDACAADPFAFIEGVRHSFALDRDGHLGQVRPLLTLDDPALHPVGSELPPELSDRALTERGAHLLHAKDLVDLGIYENTVRKAAAEEVVEAFKHGGNEAALDAVKDIHDRTENLLLRGACLQVSEGIANGSYTDDSKAAIAEVFSDIYGMQAAMGRAHKLMRTDPSAACAQLTRMLAVADEREWFADTPTRKYRYFDSYASRMMYSLRCDEADDGRDLRLPADEYYLGHYRLASILAESLEHAEEAIAHAKRCVELAPSVAAGHLRLARCYFSVFDYLSEIEVLREALRVAWNPSDVGMALYWLGYAFCMIDEYDAGVACYQACTRYESSLAETAATEVADFARRRGIALRELSQGEERAALQRAAVDLDVVDANAAFLVVAAGAVADARSYALARNLLSSAEMTLRDDAMPPVLESFED